MDGADRSTYRQAGDRLPSDLSDGEWERLAPLIPPAKPGGPAQDRHALGDERDLLSSANRLPVRYLPRRVFPPRSTVYNIFRAFRGRRVRRSENCARRCANGCGGASPSAGVIDSCSLSRRKGDARKVSTRSVIRRQEVTPRSVDTEACPCVVFTPPPFRPGRPPWSSIVSAIASIGSNSSGHSGYNARQVEHAVAAQPPLLDRHSRRSSGFIVLPRRCR